MNPNVQVSDGDQPAGRGGTVNVAGGESVVMPVDVS